MRKYLIVLLLVVSCDKYFVKPTSTNEFKNIITSYNIIYDELENNYVLDYETPILNPNSMNASHDVVVFDPMVTYYNNEFNFYFNIIHEYQSHSQITNEEQWTLYYKANSEYKKIEVKYDTYLVSEYEYEFAKGSNFFDKTTQKTYAYKIFYSINNIESTKIFDLLSQGNIEDIRVKGKYAEFELDKESKFKFFESVKFYKDVVLSSYKINNTTTTIKNNRNKYHKSVEKQQSTLNILDALF